MSYGLNVKVNLAAVFYLEFNELLTGDLVKIHAIIWDYQMMIKRIKLQLPLRSLP